jgi:hypothetical protein
VDDAAPLMRMNEEDVENAERDCWNGEEINRGELFGVSALLTVIIDVFGQTYREGQHPP